MLIKRKSHEVRSLPDPSKSRVQHSKEFPREALGTLQVRAQTRQQQGASNNTKLSQKIKLPCVQLSKQSDSKLTINLLTSHHHWAVHWSSLLFNKITVKVHTKKLQGNIVKHWVLQFIRSEPKTHDVYTLKQDNCPITTKGLSCILIPTLSSRNRTAIALNISQPRQSIDKIIAVKNANSVGRSHFLLVFQF